MQIAVGTYTGNGTSQTISGLAFTPTGLFVWPISNLPGTSYHPSFSAAYAGIMGATPNVITTNGFTLGSNQFSVGSNANVNTNLVVYHYLIHDTDNTILRTGSYVGNDADDRNITVATGYQPDMVIILAAVSTGINAVPIWAASKGGDNYWGYGSSSLFGFTANGIQGVFADGFQVGSAANTNKSGTTFYYWAWKKVTGNFFEGTYTSSGGGDNRNIVMADAFQSDAVVIIDVGQAWSWNARPSTLVGDQTILLGQAALQTDRIQALNADGFQVGTQLNIGAHVNQYFAFKNVIPAAPFTTDMLPHPEYIVPPTYGRWI
jgi:hypothetical protein